MRKGLNATITLIIAIVVMVIVALALIAVTTGNLGNFGKDASEKSGNAIKSVDCFRYMDSSSCGEHNDVCAWAGESNEKGLYCKPK